MWRLLYFVPIWLLFLLLRTVMIVLGWVVVPLAAACEAYEAYMAPHWHEGFRKQYKFTWKWMWPWDNKEDGIWDRTYWKAEEGIDVSLPYWWKEWKIFEFNIPLPEFSYDFLEIVYWSAMRNPANNLRYTPGLSVKIDKEKVKYKGSLNDNLVDPRVYDRDDLTFWYLCWQGPYSNFRVHFKMFNKIWRFWLGWKIYPEDTIWDVTGHRKESAGFATQFKRIWPK